LEALEVEDYTALAFLAACAFFLANSALIFWVMSAGAPDHASADKCLLSSAFLLFVSLLIDTRKEEPAA
jgi:hypothetical protein